MKIGAIIAVVLAITGALVYAFFNGQNPAVSSTLPEDVVIYDVRTSEEYLSGHIKNATLLPLSDIESGTGPTVSKDTPIAVYCRSGNRSAQATQLIKEMGFNNVIDMGGLGNVTKYGLKIE